ncbi:MAG: primosome assembly protein PriA [Actinomycetota bacterium]
MESVARVIVDVPLAHLDRVFDYAVPDKLAGSLTVGSRVRVRFSGRLVDAYVIELVETSEHRLQPLQRVTTSYPVLTPEVLSLCRAVSDRYAGSIPDVLRAAVPPRHARAEASILSSSAEPDAVPEINPSPAWSAYSGGEALIRRVRDGDTGWRGVLTCAPAGAVEPAGDWAMLLAQLAALGARHHGVVLVVPDARDLGRVDRALTRALGSGHHAVLSADLGPQRRYAEFLKVLTGRVRIVLGTRAAAFAPVVDPGLLLLWDDGDESLSEPHAPGWHAREVLALRSNLTGAALVSAGFTRSSETQLWIETRWAAALTPRRDLLRRIAPRVQSDDSAHDAGPARLPHRAWDAAKKAVVDGPVLVQVARRGYVPALACQECRAPARCSACAGPLAFGATGAAPSCRWCGASSPDWRCPACGSGRLRAVAIGARRTAEELGRAFPGLPILTSGGDRILDDVLDEPALVVATPGAEPMAAGGYAGVLILDARLHLSRVALRAGEETARRWFGAAALARPGAPVVVTADAAAPLVQALIRWDPGWLAQRELAERVALSMPPAVRAATLTGSATAVREAAQLLPAGARTRGPLPVADREGASRSSQTVRLLVTVPRSGGDALAEALHSIAATRSARKDPEPLALAVDPLDWGSD